MSKNNLIIVSHFRSNAQVFARPEEQTWCCSQMCLKWMSLILGNPCNKEDTIRMTIDLPDRNISIFHLWAGL